MAVISETHAALRFYGDDLDPDDLTERLGSQPSSSARKGDVMPSGHVVRTGRWILRVDQCAPGDLDGQIERILALLTDDLSVWQAVAKFRPNLFVGLFLKESNEGIEVSVENIALLAQRGVSVGLDVYGPRPDESQAAE